MRVVASEQAVRLIEESGGNLYVWPKRARCCGAVTMLESSPRPRNGVTFQRIDGANGFDLHLPAGLARLPDELHLEARRFPRRVEAYWDGCAWVV